MPQGHLTLLDIAKKNGSDPLVGLIEEVQVSSPEIELGAARTIKGITYKTHVRTNVPKGGFRGANEGTPSLKSEYANKSFEALIFNPQWDVDKAVAEADEDGKEVCIAREAEGILRGALIHLGSQFYYGTANDAKGCPGLLAQYDADNMTVDATGAGNASTSVWAVKFGPQYTQWLWGNDGQLALSDVIEQKKQDGAGNYYTALFQINERFANKPGELGTTPSGGPDGRWCPRRSHHHTGHGLRCPENSVGKSNSPAKGRSCLGASVGQRCRDASLARDCSAAALCRRPSNCEVMVTDSMPTSPRDASCITRALAL